MQAQRFQIVVPRKWYNGHPGRQLEETMHRLVAAKAEGTGTGNANHMLLVQTPL